MIVIGTSLRQYFPHPIRCPFFDAIDTPTTFADAPIGVADPPISVPIARVHASTSKLTPEKAASDLMTGIMVAANGMLSINALATADTHNMIVIIRYILFPQICSIPAAIRSSTPVFSNPPTTINSPVKNSRVA